MERHRPIAANTLMEMEEASQSCGNEAEVRSTVIELVEAYAGGRDGTLAGRSTVEGFESWLGVVVDESVSEDRQASERVQSVAGEPQGHSCGEWCFDVFDSRRRSTNS
jgi:hypothetical protein